MLSLLSGKSVNINLLISFTHLCRLSNLGPVPFSLKQEYILPPHNRPSRFVSTATNCEYPFIPLTLIVAYMARFSSLYAMNLSMFRSIALITLGCTSRQYPLPHQSPNLQNDRDILDSLPWKALSAWFFLKKYQTWNSSIKKVNKTKALQDQ